MSDMSLPKPSALSLSQARHVDEVCDRFEAAWKDGPRPHLEVYLAETPEPEYAALLRELIALEVEQRYHAGESPRSEDYQKWLPWLSQEWLAQTIEGGFLPAPNDRSAAPQTLSFPDARAEPLPDSSRRRASCVYCHTPVDDVADAAGEIRCPACGKALPMLEVSKLSPTDSPRQLGKFTLLETLGVGAFGVVWRARDTELGRLVALKIPHAGLLTSPDARERFHREARAAAQLRHPGIVSLHEVAELEGRPALVYDYIDGLTVRQLLQARRLTLQEAAELVAQVAEALDYAHAKGLVHRDIKPANIMIEYHRGQDSTTSLADQQVFTGDFALTALGLDLASASLEPAGPRALVLDFGLALHDEAESTLTAEGEVLGTPAYMSPEQARGEAHLVDGRSDVYSLGVVLYELLTGELPFRGNSRMLMQQVLHDEPLPPRKLDDRIPRDLETVCLKAMSKEPGRRYTSAKELGKDLRRFLEGKPIVARPVGHFSRLWLWCHRPERVRDAGVFVLLVNSMLMLWGVLGIVAILSSSDPRMPIRSAGHVLAVMCVSYVPAFWIGLATIARRLWALWTGAFVMLLDLGFVLARLFDFHEYDLGGLHADPMLRGVVWSLWSIYLSLQLLAYFIALRAYYANWNVMRWSKGTASAFLPDRGEHR